MIMGDPDVPSEEKEKWNLDREKVEDLHEDSRHVERVIASQEGEEETEYFVKCNCAGLLHLVSTY